MLGSREGLGALAAFGVGYTLGFSRMIGEIACKAAPPPPGSLADVLFVSTNYLYVGVLLCAASFATPTASTPPRSCFATSML